MLYFKFDPEVDPGITKSDQGKCVLILRWAMTPEYRTLSYGRLIDQRIRRGLNSRNHRAYETHLQIGNAWNELSVGDEVFLYDPATMTPTERQDIMAALGTMLMGETKEAASEIDAAISSILSAYQS